MGKSTRQMKRQQKRGRDKYEKRHMFTKEEMEASNELSYHFGLAFAMHASKDVLGLGDVRLERIRKQIKEYEKKHFDNLNQFDDFDILKRDVK